LSQGSWHHQRLHHEGILSAVSVGFFLILVGLLFISTPSLYDNVVKFFSNFKTEQVGSTNISLPIPQNLANYDIYVTIRQFSVIWGVFLIAMLGARLILSSSTRKLAENVGDITFWLGAAYMVQIFLVAPTQAQPPTIDSTKWLEFWAMIIGLIGISLIVRAIFLAAARLRRT